MTAEGKALLTLSSDIVKAAPGFQWLTAAIQTHVYSYRLMRLKPLPRIRNPRIEAELCLQISVTWIQIKVLESLSLKQNIVSDKVKCVFQPQPLPLLLKFYDFQFFISGSLTHPFAFLHMTFPLSLQAPRSFFYPYSSTMWILKPIYILEAWGSGYFKNEGLWNLRHFLGAGLCKITKNWGQKFGSKVKGTFCQA